jgi:hypothetical protein
LKCGKASQYWLKFQQTQPKHHLLSQSTYDLTAPTVTNSLSLFVFWRWHLGCNLNNLQMSHCLCAHNAPLLSSLDMQSVQLTFQQFVTRVLSKQETEFHECLWEKLLHLRKPRLHISAYSVLSSHVVLQAGWQTLWVLKL